ncbi:hypothetical protein FF38_04413 [Lucilia cuprina]|uniref:Uncharacterized protein n=1 Tax=Lucilia cuprina TaxID=7375 RepID=A0A0L0BQ97_LUCCU|nr:hypothetical protein FF38_04413 [Lucilia cuprina]
MTIKIENRTFSNWQASPLQTVPATLQPTPFEKRRFNLLSLEALSELQINNTDIITTMCYKTVEKVVVWEPQVPAIEKLFETTNLPQTTQITIIAPDKPPRLHKIPLF